MTGSGWICVRSISGVVGVFLAARPVLGFRTDSLGALRGLDRWKSRRSSGVLSRHFDFLNPKGWLWQGSAAAGGAVKRRLESLLAAAQAGGGDASGDDGAFLERWGYDEQQKAAIAEAILSVAESA